MDSGDLASSAAPAADAGRSSAGRVRVQAWPARGHRRGNPYSYLLAEALEASGAAVAPFAPRQVLGARADVVHVHWPEWVLDARGRARRARRAPLLLGALAAARRRGAVVVWTVHNLGGHERSRTPLDRWCWDRFVDHVDGFVSLTRAGVGRARAAIPALADRPCMVIPHGHYRGEYPDTTTAAAARAALGIPPDARVAVAFGHVRPYKNTEALVRAFAAVDGDDVRLVVAGRPLDAGIRAQVIDAAGGDPRVLLHLDFVASGDVQTYLRAADVVVLPYLESLNSGAGLLALSFDRPVLAPRRGAFAELEEEVGSAWVRTYDGALQPEVLAAALRTAPPSPPRPDLAAFEWDRIGETTVAFYRELIAHRHGSGIRRR